MKGAIILNRVYGYCRISTPKQSIDRQVRNILLEYPDAIIVKEIFTGTRYQVYKELDKIIRKVKAGDTIVFDSVSRMSRNADEGFALYKSLYDRGINLVFLKEHHIDTDVYKNELERQRLNVSVQSGDKATDALMNAILEALNNYILALAEKQIQLAFIQSQKEVDDLHQRTREGIETARRNGKQIGQKAGRKLKVKKATPIKEMILKYSRDFNGTNTDAEVKAIINGNPDPKLHIGHNAYYKYKRELREVYFP